MEFAYKPEIWRGFFEIVALAAVTLTGFLSVALSINVRHIVDTPAHLARGREALITLTVLLTLSIFVLIPEQGRAALGIELIALSMLVFIVAVRLEAMTLRGLPAQHRRRWMTRLIGLNSVPLAITLAGASLLAGRFGGLLWLIHTTLTGLVWSTYNAWNLTIRVPDALERRPPAGVEDSTHGGKTGGRLRQKSRILSDDEEV